MAVAAAPRAPGALLLALQARDVVPGRGVLVPRRGPHGGDARAAVGRGAGAPCGGRAHLPRRGGLVPAAVA
eukprot:11160272-Lingulodinium_polyedra.AAC.1